MFSHNIYTLFFVKLLSNSLQKIILGQFMTKEKQEILSLA